MVDNRQGVSLVAVKLTTVALVGSGLLLIVANALLRWGKVDPGSAGAVLAINSITILNAVVLVIFAWWSGPSRQYLIPTGAALAVLGVQWLVAMLAVQTRDPLAVSLQLFAALIVLGISVYMVAIKHLAQPIARYQVPAAAYHLYNRTIVLAILGVLINLVTGVLVSHNSATTACPDWPLCRGEIFPAGLTPAVGISLLHRFSVLAVAVLVAAIVLQTCREYSANKLLVRWSWLLGMVYLVQGLAGGLYSLALPQESVTLLHLVLTALIWMSLIVVGTIQRLTSTTIRQDSEPQGVNRMILTGRQRALTFFKLTKPWILVLLLITTLMAMVIAAEGLPSLSLMLYTLLGGALSAAGASVLNSYIDSDIDRLMSRTSRRATVTGLVTPQETLIFGLTLSLLSFLIFAIFVNMLSAILSTIGIIYYVFFYTLYLKRSTIHNIIIGGAAGAIPPLVGWTAVTHRLDLGAFYLFAIIFFWTPPHTWALALMIKKDYAQAGVPMLPVVVGDKETTYQIFLYSILLITLTLLPVTFMLSWVYFVFALILGGRFLYLAWKLWQNYSKPVSRQLYKYSQLYLALLFLLMAVDRAIF